MYKLGADRISFFETGPDYKQISGLPDQTGPDPGFKKFCFTPDHYHDRIYENQNFRPFLSICNRPLTAGFKSIDAISVHVESNNFSMQLQS